MKKNLLMFIMMLVGGAAVSQTARVQVIHNAADAAAAQVDVYVNGDLLLDNFAFRTASPFVDVDAGVPLSIVVAPSTSASAADGIYTLNTTLTAGETYILVANGIVSTTGYTPNQPFALYPFALGREAAETATNTDVLVFHGATDAPTVDVVAQGAGTIVDNISYGSYIADYLELATDDYVLNVTTADGATVVASYQANLETLDLDGDAITVLASGFLNPADNSNGPAFGLWVALAEGGPLVALPAAVSQTARVQVIHNAADAAAAQVDVYVNGDLLLDNFAFRTASPFVDVDAGVPLSIVVAPSTSASAADGIYTLNTTLTADETYILVANGIVSTTGYTPNQPFALYPFALGREAAETSTNTDVLVFHGATDAPTVDVVAQGAGTIVNDISYGNYIADYLELATDDYVLDVTTADGATVVASYQAPLETLDLDGDAITVLASGFLNPADNSNGPAFGLWVALPEGGPLVQLPAAITPQTARVQVIHNAADAAAAQVDVYVNGDLLLDNFAFRTASPFVDVDASVPLSIVVAPSTSASAADGIYTLNTTLTAGETYILVANGIVSTTGYTPNQPFALYPFALGREAAETATNTDVLVFHGATDAPTVDVVAQGAGTIVDNISYGSYISDYLELATDDYVLDVTTADGATVVASYQAPLETLDLDGDAITVLASGFLNPADNSNGPAFGLWASLPAGGPLVQLPQAPLSNTEFTANAVTIYPNPAKGIINIAVPNSFGFASSTFYDLTGRSVLTATGNTINVSSLNNGVYVMETSIDGRSTSRKVVIEN